MQSISVAGHRPVGLVSGAELPALRPISDPEPHPVRQVSGAEFSAVRPVSGAELPAVRPVSGVELPAVRTVSGGEHPALRTVSGTELAASRIELDIRELAKHGEQVGYLSKLERLALIRAILASDKADELAFLTGTVRADRGQGVEGLKGGSH